MTEIFRITGLHSINFDEGATGPYRLAEGSVPRDMDQILSRQEVISLLPKLPPYPEGLRSHCLAKGVSKVGCDVSIQADRNAGETDADMERYRQRLTRTLEDAGLYIATQGARGTRAVLHYKMNNAINDSYKTILWGELEEMGGRDVLGAKVKHSYLERMKLTLYCEKCWRPLAGVPIGPNEIYTPSFGEDGNADGRADNWDARGAPVLAMESTIVLHGCKSQKATTDAANEGVESKAITAPAGVTAAMAYAWICRPAAGSDVRVIMRETTGGGADIATASLDVPPPGGWRTALAKDKVSEFSQVVVSTAAGITPARTYELWIESTGVADTVYYVDKCFWKWGTVTVPDEWCGHGLLYNHKDKDAGHINYLDLADLKGDVEAPIKATIKSIQGFETISQIWIARRTRGTPCCFQHFYEAENAAAQDAWADQVDANASNGFVVRNAANVTGSVRWDVVSELANQRGRFRVLGRLQINTVANNPEYNFYLMQESPFFVVQRLTVRPVNTNPLMIDFGTLYLPSIPISLANWGNVYIQTEYIKAALDVLWMDCLYLFPEDECALKLQTLGPDTLDPTHSVIYDQVADFPVAFKTGPNNLLMRTTAGTLGEMRFKPGVDNRLYFFVLNGDIWNVHSTAGSPAEIIQVTALEYLPQFIGPLE